jgi:hypothetical protein
MDLLAVLRKRLDALPPGDYHPGLRAVVQHVEVATSHLTRGAAQADDTAFTDAIYRTNQAFEGSLKEAYRVLTGSDPLKKSPFEIESFLQEQSILRGRVIGQLSNYRKEWRNPSTHDYRLDFDEDEALLAIVSVCAFAIVLIDQIAEKLSFEAARAKSQPVPSPKSDTTPLVELIASAVERFDIEPATPRSQDFAREAEVVGSLAGFLTVALPRATIDLEPRFWRQCFRAPGHGRFDGTAAGASGGQTYSTAVPGAAASVSRPDGSLHRGVRH